MMMYLIIKMMSYQNMLLIMETILNLVGMIALIMFAILTVIMILDPLVQAEKLSWFFNKFEKLYLVLIHYLCVCQYWMAICLIWILPIFFILHSTLVAYYVYKSYFNTFTTIVVTILTAILGVSILYMLIIREGKRFGLYKSNDPEEFDEEEFGSEVYDEEMVEIPIEESENISDSEYDYENGSGSDFDFDGDNE
jgi:hypothetical protein